MKFTHLMIRYSTGPLAVRRLAPWVVFAAMVFPVLGELTTNPPLVLTHSVQVQPIRVKKSDGTAAVVMGNAASEAYIKDQIDQVWAQSGLVIEWLPVVDYVNDFAYDGSPGNYTSSKARPQSHLSTIINSAGAPPKSANATVINLFFVEVVPGFPDVPENTANGLAYVDFNGITAHVGETLVHWQGGRDVIAEVLAHEIGHNLGLYHASNGGDNLMSPYGTSARVTGSQTATIFTDSSGFDGYEFLGTYSAPTNYEVWADALELVGGPESDDDADGIINVIEFMLGMDGNSPDAHAMPAPVWGPAGLTWTLPKVSGALNDGLSYEVEVSSNASSWVAAGTAGSGSTVVNDDDTTLVVRLDAGQPHAFMRLKTELSLPLASSQSFIPLEALKFLSSGFEPVLSDCCHDGCGSRTAQQPES